MYNKLPVAVRHLDGRRRTSLLGGLVLVNDCRSDVSPVNNSDSDWTIRMLFISHL